MFSTPKSIACALATEIARIVDMTVGVSSSGLTPADGVVSETDIRIQRMLAFDNLVYVKRDLPLRDCYFKDIGGTVLVFNCHNYSDAFCSVCADKPLTRSEYVKHLNATVNHHVGLLPIQLPQLLRAVTNVLSNSSADYVAYFYVSAVARFLFMYLGFNTTHSYNKALHMLCESGLVDKK